MKKTKELLDIVKHLKAKYFVVTIKCPKKPDDVAGIHRQLDNIRVGSIKNIRTYNENALISLAIGPNDPSLSFLSIKIISIA